MSALLKEKLFLECKYYWTSEELCVSETNRKSNFISSSSKR